MHDYVIVGAGSAGCVLANRLSEDPSVRVLLLEAGGSDRSPKIEIPAAFAKQFQTKLDWDYATEPEPGGRALALYPARQGAGRIELDERDALRARAPARLRPLGGSGRAGLGLERRAAVLPARREQRARRVRVPRHRRPAQRVSDQRSPRSSPAAYLPPPRRRHPAHRRLQRPRAGRRRRWCRSPSETAAAGAPPTPTCARTPTATTSRCVTGAQVMRVELEGGRAVGVRYRDRRGREQLARADREVVLAAGSIGSPQLLHALRHRSSRSPARGPACPPRPTCRASGRTSRTTRTWSASGSRRWANRSTGPTSRRRWPSG